MFHAETNTEPVARQMDKSVDIFTKTSAYRMK